MVKMLVRYSFVVAVVNSGVLSPTMPSAVSHDQYGLNGAYATSNSQAFVVTHNIVAKDGCSD